MPSLKVDFRLVSRFAGRGCLVLRGELAELGCNTDRLGPYLSVPTSISPVYHAAGKYPPVNLLHRAKCPWEWDLLAKVSLLRSAQLGTARRQYVVRWANNRSADQSGSHGVLLELISEPHARSLHAHTRMLTPPFGTDRDACVKREIRTLYRTFHLPRDPFSAGMKAALPV